MTITLKKTIYFTSSWGEASPLKLLGGSGYLEGSAFLPLNLRSKDGLESSFSLFLYVELFQMFHCMSPTEGGTNFWNHSLQ
jgi:hypothetical protein